MLRESSIAYGYDLDYTAIADPSVPLGVPGGNSLMQLVDATIAGTTRTLSDAHEQIVDELGPEALLDAAAVFGNFEMMNRIAEGTGIPLTRRLANREHTLISDLGLRP